MPWTVDFYEDDKQNAPVETFIASLSEQKQGKILQCIQMLEEYGPNLPYPYSSQIEGKLRELRAHFGRENYRILYYGDRLREFILLHAFVKKSKQLPQKHRKLALDRMNHDIKRKREKE